MITRITILLLLLSNSLSASESDGLDSLLALHEQSVFDEDHSQIMENCFQLGRQYFHLEDFKNSIKYYKKAIKKARELSNEEFLAKSYYYLGWVNSRTSNYSEALSYYMEASKYSFENVEELSLARVYSGISSIYRSLGEYEKAYSTEMKVLSEFEEKNDTSAIAGCYYNIGTIFFYQKQFGASLENYQKAFDLVKLLDAPRLQYSCLGGLGSVYAELEQKGKANEYNMAALELARDIGYKTGIGYSLGNLASQHEKEKNYKEAKNLLNQSLNIKKEIGDSWGVVGSLTSLGKIAIVEKKFDDALDYLKEALELSIEIDSKPRQSDLNQELSILYDEMGNKELSLLYLQKYVALKDVILNEKTLEEMGRSKGKYEVQKREHEISMLKKENELLGATKKIQKLQIYLFAIAGIFLLMFTGWFMKQLKFSRNMNALLEEKNDLLNSKNDEINVTNKRLEVSNQNLTQFAYVASHDLKEPLRMIHSYTSLLKRKYGSSFDDTGHEFMYYITDAVGRMQTLLDDLLDFSRADGSVGDADLINVNDATDIVNANLRHRFEEDNSVLIIHKENMPIVRAHRTQLVQLFQNLVSNGLKFKADRDPVVEVDCRKENDKYIFSVKDNGIGISKKNQARVFEMFGRLHTKEEYEGTGIGLATCERIVNSLGGEIWLTSEEGVGTTFLFSLPIPTDVPELIS